MANTLKDYYTNQQERFERTRTRIREQEAKRLIRTLRRIARRHPAGSVLFFENEQGIRTCSFAGIEFRTLFSPSTSMEDFQFVESKLEHEGFFCRTHNKEIVSFSCA